MTKDKKAKKAARALSKSTGVSYTAAKRAISSMGSTGPGGRSGSRARTTEELIGAGIGAVCDRLVGEAVRFRGNQHLPGTWVDIDLPPGLHEPLVHQLDIDKSTVQVHVAEVYEGGTEACNVVAEGMITVEALMAKPDAIVSANRSLVTVIDADFDHDHSSVVTSVAIEAEFEAIVNPAYESVEDLAFTGATQLAAGPPDR